MTLCSMSLHVLWAPQELVRILNFDDVFVFHTVFFELARGDASIHLLRPILIHLRVNEMTPRLHTCLMDLLQSQPIDDDSFNLVIPSTPATFDPQLRDSFRRSLGQHLFGWDVLLSLRLRLAITDFCWVSPNTCFPRISGLMPFAVQSITAEIIGRPTKAKRVRGSGADSPERDFSPHTSYSLSAPRSDSRRSYP
jgi:hypothetical protein